VKGGKLFKALAKRFKINKISFKETFGEKDLREVKSKLFKNHLIP